jgi:hypothetical protein
MGGSAEALRARGGEGEGAHPDCNRVVGLSSTTFFKSATTRFHYENRPGFGVERRP